MESEDEATLCMFDVWGVNENDKNNQVMVTVFNKSMLVD